MVKLRRRLVVSGVVAVSLAVGLVTAVQAGQTLDYGQLTGLPVQANYIAWMGDAGTPPSQVLTEDGHNSSTGVDQGYQSLFWLLNASNFENPASRHGDSLNFVFGGLGDDWGTTWVYSATYDKNSTDPTNHGVVGTQGSGTCPIMTQGSWDGNEKVINWTGPAGTYHVYSTTLASGASNGASNGRYNYVDTVTTTGSSGSYTDEATVQSWHIVVPADSGTGAINGCHSEESNPNVVTLSSLSATGAMGRGLGVAGLALLAVAAFGAILYVRRR